MSELVLIRHPHEHNGDAPAYHEWVYMGQKIKADSRGRDNPRMYTAPWQKWICNNPDCPGVGLVHDQAVQGLLEAAEESS